MESSPFESTLDFIRRSAREIIGIVMVVVLTSDVPTAF